MRHRCVNGAQSVTREEDGHFLVEVEGGTVYRAPAVVYTAGGTPRPLGAKGEKKYMGRGVSYCAICDGAGTCAMTFENSADRS